MRYILIFILALQATNIDINNRFPPNALMWKDRIFSRINYML